MFQVRLPSHCRMEAEWICSVVFEEFLGLPFSMVPAPASAFTVQYANRTLTLPDVFFSQAVNAWLSPATIPKLPLAQWDVVSSGLDAVLVENTTPILFGSPGYVVDESGNFRLNLDILGSAFFMLSRYEEAVEPDRDYYDRFPATASIAYQAGFLDRPIVDEYVEILWAAMKRVWPNLERQTRQARTLVSCDVDNPYICISKSLPKTVKAMGGDLLKRKSPATALQTLNQYLQVRRDDYSQDPYLKAIGWIMEANEQAGNRVAFYFISDHSHPTLDGCYIMDEPVIRNLIRRIHARGHEVGLHASYNTYRDAAQTVREADILRRVMEAEGVQQDEMGGRQHFLRWETPTTARNWEAAGMDYDSTLSYADRPGFRCGTCREYLMYDVVERRPLKLKQRPLIVMECSVIADRYLGLGYTNQALDLMLTLKRRALRYGGNFTLLWHNSHFNHPKDREFYQALVTG
jgi:hypothetical protein